MCDPCRWSAVVRLVSLLFSPLTLADKILSFLVVVGVPFIGALRISVFRGVLKTVSGVWCAVLFLKYTCFFCDFSPFFFKMLLLVGLFCGCTACGSGQLW